MAKQLGALRTARLEAEVSADRAAEAGAAYQTRESGGRSAQIARGGC